MCLRRPGLLLPREPRGLLVPCDLARLADALALAARDIEGGVWARASLIELQDLGAPSPCEVGRLLGRRTIGGHAALREHTAGRVVWRRAGRGFDVRPWGVRDAERGAYLARLAERRPAVRAPALDLAARRAAIAAAARRREEAA